MFMHEIVTFASKPPVIGGGGDAPAASELVPGSPAGTTTAPARGGGMDIIMFGLLIFFVFMIFTTMMSGKKEKKRKAELLSSLARHDKVQTVGGIIGSIVEIDDTEIIIRTDEATNTRIRVARTAIQTVLKKGRTAGAEAETKPDALEVGA